MATEISLRVLWKLVIVGREDEEEFRLGRIYWDYFVTVHVNGDRGSMFKQLVSEFLSVKRTYEVALRRDDF